MHEHICLTNSRSLGETCPNYQQATKLNSKTFLKLKVISAIMLIIEVGHKQLVK